MNKRYLDLQAKIRRFTTVFKEATSVSKHYGTKYKLYPSEIHMIEIINDLKGMNTTQLAYRMGVSKAAVSKLTTKLEHIGFIEKYKEENNNKSTYYRLTEQGYKAYEGHIEYHKKLDMDFYTRLDKYSDEETKFILNFFKEIIEHYEQYTVPKKTEEEE